MVLSLSPWSHEQRHDTGPLVSKQKLLECTYTRFQAHTSSSFCPWESPWLCQLQLQLQATAWLTPRSSCCLLQHQLSAGLSRWFWFGFLSGLPTAFTYFIFSSNYKPSQTSKALQAQTVPGISLGPYLLQLQLHLACQGSLSMPLFVVCAYSSYSFSNFTKAILVWLPSRTSSSPCLLELQHWASV